MDLTGKAFFILGGGSGIGAATTARLTKRGASVVIGGRDSEKLNHVAALTGCATVVVDGTSEDQVEHALEECLSRVGRLDGVVNCAGSIILKPLHLTSLADFRATVDTNLTTTFLLVRGAVKRMSEGGSIVVCGTGAARVGLANHEAIAAAKGGVAALALSAAATYASKGIRVNCVAPGLVRSPLSERILTSPAGEKASLAMHALPRLGEVDDVAAMIELLLSPEGAWITGQVIGVDGGLATIKRAS